jgi:hypothetical protein
MDLNTRIQGLQDVLFVIDQDQVVFHSTGTRKSLTDQNRQRMQKGIDDFGVVPIDHCMTTAWHSRKQDVVFATRRDFLAHGCQYKP